LKVFIIVDELLDESLGYLKMDTWRWEKQQSWAEEKIKNSFFVLTSG